MEIKTVYNIGENVKIRNYRTKEYIVTAEIVRISIHSTKNGIAIRYTMRYASDGEVFDTDRWETDLMEEDLTCSAMPKLLVVVPGKEA